MAAPQMPIVRELHESNLRNDFRLDPNHLRHLFRPEWPEGQRAGVFFCLCRVFEPGDRDSRSAVAPDPGDRALQPALALVLFAVASGPEELLCTVAFVLCTVAFVLCTIAFVLRAAHAIAVCSAGSA